MIASLRGRLRRKLEDRVVVEAGGVGYEVFVPPVTQQELAHRKAADGDAAAATLQSFVHDAWPSISAMLANAQRERR